MACLATPFRTPRVQAPSSALCAALTGWQAHPHATSTSRLRSVKLTKPAAFTHERLARKWDDVVVGGATAAYALGFGDLFPYPCRMYAPSAIRSTLPDMSLAVRRVDERDVTYVFGFPVTRSERTILDLVLNREDPSLVADALADAARSLARPKYLDVSRLSTLFHESKGRWGAPAGVLDTLLAEASIINKEYGGLSRGPVGRNVRDSGE